MLKIPQSMLVHSITYDEFVEKDVNGDMVYKESITVQPVRVDEGVGVGFSTTQVSLSYTRLIFVYTEYVPQINFVKQSLITFQGKAGVLKNIVPVTHPYKDEVWCWELEVE